MSHKKFFNVLLFFITLLLASAASGEEMKSTEFIKSYTATPSDIDELKAITGKDLPDWYVKHYLSLAGLQRGELKDHEVDDNSHADFTARFDGGGSDGDHITGFLTVAQIKQAWPYIDYLEEYVEDFEISPDFVQWEHLFPLAGTGDGTLYVAIGGAHDRAVFEADNGDYGIGRVSDDIDAFVAELGIVLQGE